MKSITKSFSIFSLSHFIRKKTSIHKYCAEGYGDLPQKVVCHKCGTILYEGVDLKTPDEIIQIHDGKCPKCGKKLYLIPRDVEVKPARFPR